MDPQTIAFINSYKQTTIFQLLRQDKGFQQSIAKLGSTKEWKELGMFVDKLNQKLQAELWMWAKNMDELNEYKNQILAMRRIVLLPEAVKLVKEVEQEEKLNKEKVEAEAKRKKFNPGGWVKNTVSKMKGGE